MALKIDKKIWRKTDFLLQERQKFDEFWSEHSKVSKICSLRKTNLWFENSMRNLANFHQSTWQSQNWEVDGIVQSWKYMSLKFIGELCFMAMKNDAKLKRNWLVSSKLTWGIWRMLTQATRKSQKFALYWDAFDQSI